MAPFDNGRWLMPSATLSLEILESIILLVPTRYLASSIISYPGLLAALKAKIVSSEIAETIATRKCRYAGTAFSATGLPINKFGLVTWVFTLAVSENRNVLSPPGLACTKKPTPLGIILVALFVPVNIAGS